MSESEASAYISSALAAWDSGFSEIVDASDPASNDVRVAVSIPVDDVAFLDPVGVFSVGRIAVDATMRRES